MLTNQLALLTPDFLFQIFSFGFLCVVQHSEFDGVASSLPLRKNAIFALGAGADAHIMRSDPLQHIQTFSDVNNLIFDFDTVNAWVLVLGL